jgi:hypothetical protein
MRILSGAWGVAFLVNVLIGGLSQLSYVYSFHHIVLQRLVMFSRGREAWSQ